MSADSVAEFRYHDGDPGDEGLNHLMDWDAELHEITPGKSTYQLGHMFERTEYVDMWISVWQDGHALLLCHLAAPVTRGDYPTVTFDPAAQAFLSGDYAYAAKLAIEPTTCPTCGR